MQAMRQAILSAEGPKSKAVVDAGILFAAVFEY